MSKYNPDYYQKNKDKIKERNKKWYNEHKDYMKPRMKKYSHDYYQQHIEEIKEYHITRLYGLSLSEFNAILEQQDYKCAICGKPLENRKNVHIDHDHETQRVRGVLCGSCNMGIGQFGDNPSVVHKAYKYLYRGRLSELQGISIQNVQ